MKKFTLVFFLVTLLLSTVTFAQDILVVDPGVGTLNAAIAANGGNKIYQLQAGEWYQIDGVIENVDYHLQIIGEEPEAGEMPATLQTNADAGGGVFGKMFNAFGDITVKGIYVVNADLNGVVAPNFIEQNMHGGHVVVDKCILDPVTTANGVTDIGGNARIYFTNNQVLRMGHQLNPNDGHFFNTGGSGDGVDTLYVENNTFVCMGTNMFAGNFNNAVHNYIKFNHNTWVMQKSQIEWVDYEETFIFTNNLMFDYNTQPWAANWQPMPGADVNQPKPALIYADTIPGETLPSTRQQFWEYNMLYRNPKFYDLLDELNVWAVTNGKPVLNYQPFLWPVDSINAVDPNNIPRETVLFANDEAFPNWKEGNNLADIDPMFEDQEIYTYSDKFVEWTRPASMIHALGDAADNYPPASQWPQWHWDPDGDPAINSAWPVFNGKYTNEELLKASIENLPLGDLNWFPEAKVRWEAQKDEIDAHVAAGNEEKFILTSAKPEIKGTSFSAECYPNPFSKETTISFELQARTDVNVTIVNLVGQKITTLMSSEKSAGSYKVSWNGTDNSGNMVNSGIYFYTISTETGSQTGRIVLSK